MDVIFSGKMYSVNPFKRHPHQIPGDRPHVPQVVALHRPSCDHQELVLFSGDASQG